MNPYNTLCSWPFYHKLITATTTALKENFQTPSVSLSSHRREVGACHFKAISLSMFILSLEYLFLSLHLFYFALPCQSHMSNMQHSSPCGFLIKSSFLAIWSFKALFSLLPCFSSNTNLKSKHSLQLIQHIRTNIITFFSPVLWGCLWFVFLLKTKGEISEQVRNNRK